MLKELDKTYWVGDKWPVNSKGTVSHNVISDLD